MYHEKMNLYQAFGIGIGVGVKNRVGFYDQQPNILTFQFWFLHLTKSMALFSSSNVSTVSKST